MKYLKISMQANGEEDPAGRKSNQAGAETGTFNASLDQIALLLLEPYIDHVRA
jgi:hypothetical protein